MSKSGREEAGYLSENEIKLIETSRSLDEKYALIDKVLVYDPEHVEIKWKFSDEVMELMKI